MLIQNCKISENRRIIALDPFSQKSQISKMPKTYKPLKERIAVPEPLVPYVQLLVRLDSKGDANEILEMIKTKALPEITPKQELIAS